MQFFLYNIYIITILFHSARHRNQAGRRHNGIRWWRRHAHTVQRNEDSDEASFLIVSAKQARASSLPLWMSAFFVSSSIMLLAADKCLRWISSFIVRYFLISSSTSLYSSSEILQSSRAFEMWLWTVLSFAEANTKTALCFAALAEQRRAAFSPNS